jgi:low temperature requirement protein LtrA
MSEPDRETPTERDLAHHLTQMRGRNPHERGRTSSPLELFFDLVFVIAISGASAQLATALAKGHTGSGILAFCFCLFAIMWAWVNFSWFASAFDTDDWLYRLTTMLQMVGVLILAMGIAPVFSSVEKGGTLDNRILVGGYVVMRVAMVFQWLRVARQDPEHRECALTYVKFIAAAQVGWVLLIFPDLSLGLTLLCMVPLYALEFLGPVFAERKGGGTPWHPHHIAERYGLIVIIALGECLIGTVAALQSVVESQGWSWEVAVVGLSGVGIAFTLWWIYFAVPMGDGLHAHRRMGFVFGYGHIVLVAAVAAIGAGLHVAAYYLEHKATLSSMGALLTVVIPMLVFWVMLITIYTAVISRDALHVRETVMVVAILALAVVLAQLHVALTICLVVAACALVPTIITDERLGVSVREQALRDMRS